MKKERKTTTVYFVQPECFHLYRFYFLIVPTGEGTELNYHSFFMYIWILNTFPCFLACFGFVELSTLLAIAANSEQFVFPFHSANPVLNNMTKAQVMMNELMYIRRRMNACVCMEINEKQFFSISCLRFVGDGGCVGVDVSPNNKLKNYDRLINISNRRMLPPQTICLRWHEHKTTTLDICTRIYVYVWV